MNHEKAIKLGFVDQCLDFMLNTTRSNWGILNKKTTWHVFVIKTVVATVFREALREAKEEMGWFGGC